jgi:hypothetical protein
VSETQKRFRHCVFPKPQNKERDQTMTAYEFVTDVLLGMIDPDELEQIVKEAIDVYDDNEELIEIHDLLVFQNSAMKEFKQKYKEIETKYNAPVA